MKMWNNIVDNLDKKIEEDEQYLKKFKKVKKLEVLIQNNIPKEYEIIKFNFFHSQFFEIYDFSFILEKNIETNLFVKTQFSIRNYFSKYELHGDISCEFRKSIQISEQGEYLKLEKMYKYERIKHLYNWFGNYRDLEKFISNDLKRLLDMDTYELEINNKINEINRLKLSWSGMEKWLRKEQKEYKHNKLFDDILSLISIPKERDNLFNNRGWSTLTIEDLNNYEQVFEIILHKISLVTPYSATTSKYTPDENWDNYFNFMKERKEMENNNG